MSRISQNLQDVHARIAAAAAKVSRDPQDILMLAVSKKFNAETVMQAIEAGQLNFGENYVQEALEKIEEVARLQNNALEATGKPIALLKWHFIGPIQSNKTRSLATHFDWVHSIERETIASRLSDQRPEGMTPLNICIQVNVSHEDSKSGVAPDEVPQLARAIAGMRGLCLRGLMAIPQATTDFETQTAAFRTVRELYTQLKNDGLAVDTLSIGMSADLEAAINEGATIVRIGSAIFGQRS
jgi:pyridoxal phosphate enzyme (YggS family)